MFRRIRLFLSFFIWPLLLIAVDLYAQKTIFNADSIYASIAHLSETLGPRPLGSRAEREALEWAVRRCLKYGADTAFVMPFSRSHDDDSDQNFTSGVAVGIFRGETDSSIVIGAHIDSEGWNVPGANDDASGAATALELVRVWSGRPKRYTLIFAAFGGEEYGLYGSTFFVQNYPDTQTVRLMFSLDMTGSDGDVVTLPESKHDQAPVWLIRDAFLIDRKLGLDRLSYPTHFGAFNAATEGAGSDHIPFLDHGIPAIDFTTGLNDSPIHTPQDNLENIHKPALDLYVRFIDTLIAKYQTDGIPKPETAHSVFWNPFGLILFVPLWVFYVLVALAFGTTVLAFLKSRAARHRIPKEGRVRFSGLKAAGLALVVTLIARSGGDVIGLIRGIRHPWFLHIYAYLWFTIPLVILGGWLALQLARRWGFTPDPHAYAKRGLILLTLATAGALVISIRVAVYPALALFAAALGILAPNPFLKSVLFLFAPLPVVRLIFNEALPFFARIIPYVSLMTQNRLAILIPDLVLTLFFFLGIWPFLLFWVYGAAASPALRIVFRQFRRKLFGWLCLALVVGWGVYLSRLPAYDAVWRPFVRVGAEYDLSKQKGTLRLSGTEYLKGIRVTTDSLDLDLNRRVLRDTLPVSFRADWMSVTGGQSLSPGEKDTIRADWMIRTRRPWRKIVLTLKPDTLEIDTLVTEWKSRRDDKEARISWIGDLPDSIRVPFKMVVGKGAGLIRKIEATYSDLPAPVTVASDLANVYYRTVVTLRDTLRFAETAPDSLEGN